MKPREFAGLIDYAHREVQPSANRLQVVWDFDIIGMQLRGEQHFATAPCVFDLSCFKDGELRWKLQAEFERAPNTPHTLFGKLVDDETAVGIFAVIWRCVVFPHMVDGDEDLCDNDLLMLRMSKDLWEYP